MSLGNLFLNDKQFISGFLLISIFQISQWNHSKEARQFRASTRERRKDKIWIHSCFFQYDAGWMPSPGRLSVEIIKTFGSYYLEEREISLDDTVVVRHFVCRESQFGNSTFGRGGGASSMETLSLEVSAVSLHCLWVSRIWNTAPWKRRH